MGPAQPRAGCRAPPTCASEGTGGGLKQRAGCADKCTVGSCSRVVLAARAALLAVTLGLLRALRGALALGLELVDGWQRRVEAERSACALLAERARLTGNSWRAAFEAAPVGIAKVDLAGRLEEVNPALCALLGEPRSALCGRRLSALVYPDDLPVLHGPGHPGRSGRRLARAELRLIGAGGRLRWCELASVLVRDGRGRPDHVLVHVVDITRHKRSQAQLRDLATRDPLTGLANRRWFELQLSRHARACLEDGPRGAVVVIDLDNFKAVNDTLGHHAGDRLVIEAAVTFRRHLRDEDLLARLGGDEFAVLLRDGGARAAETVARKLVLAARDELQTFGGVGGLSRSSGAGGRRGAGATERVANGAASAGAASTGEPLARVTVSVGVAPFEALAGKGPDQVMRAADAAMYSVKRSGRNGYAIYGSPGGPHHARPARVAGPGHRAPLARSAPARGASRPGLVPGRL